MSNLFQALTLLNADSSPCRLHKEESFGGLAGYRPRVHKTYFIAALQPLLPKQHLYLYTLTASMSTVKLNKIERIKSMPSSTFLLPENFPVGYYNHGMGPITVFDMIRHVESNIQTCAPYSIEKFGELTYIVVPSIYNLSREEVIEFSEISTESCLVSPKFLIDSCYYLIQDLSPRILYRKNHMFKKGEGGVDFMERHLELSHPTEDLSDRFNNFLLMSRLSLNWIGD